MNQRLSFCLQTFIIGALFVGQSFAAAAQPIAPPIVVYPQYRLTPASPTTQDSVSFWLIKGQYGNSCVPRYITSFRIEHVAVACLVAPCPSPFNEIILSYSQSLVLPLQAAGFCDPAPCPNVIVCMNTTTEYGPMLNFGKLQAGNYTIIDSTDSNRTLMQFTVTENPLPYANKAQKTIDNVTYTVATDKTSYNVGENINVRYTIKNNSAEMVIDSLPCCRENLLAMTPSGDTAYHQGGLPCPCPPVVPPVSIAPGDSMVSDFTPFTYADTARSLTIIAKLGWNEIYSHYSTPAVSVLVGINQAGTPVLQRNIQKTLIKNTPIVTYSRSSKTLAITSDRPQLISISAYTLNGRKIAELSGNRFLNVGTQTFNMKNAARYGGMMLFRIQGEGFVETARINFIN
jgi:hypothetical protein